MITILLLLLLTFCNVAHCHEIFPNTYSALLTAAVKTVEQYYNTELTTDCTVYIASSSKQYTAYIQRHKMAYINGQENKRLLHHLKTTSIGVTRNDSNVILIDGSVGYTGTKRVLLHELVHRYQFQRGKDYCKKLGRAGMEDEAIKTADKLLPSLTKSNIKTLNQST